MPSHRYSVVAALAACTSLIALAGTAGAAKPAPAPLRDQTIKLDTYEPNNDGFAGPVSPRDYLIANRPYVVEAQGTFSLYAAREYSKSTLDSPWNTVCGTPESSPMFPSTYAPDGPVGQDPEFVFARPWKRRKCQTISLPTHWPNFEARSDKSTGYAHPALIGPRPTTPSTTHTYSYALMGTGASPQFRLRDRPTSD